MIQCQILQPNLVANVKQDAENLENIRNPEEEKGAPQ